MDIREKLLKNDRKIISIDDLAEILGIRMSELKDIYEQVEILVKDNLLSPVLNSGIIIAIRKNTKSLLFPQNVCRQLKKL